MINALTTGGKLSSRAHIPYRDSKLTRVLEVRVGQGVGSYLMLIIHINDYHVDSHSNINMPNIIIITPFLGDSWWE